MDQVAQGLKTVLSQDVLSFVPQEPQEERSRLADYWEVVVWEFAWNVDKIVDLEGVAVLVHVVLAFGQALPASLDSVATVLQSDRVDFVWD